MEDKDYAGSNKIKLCDNSILHELKDPSLSKLHGRKFLNGLKWSL